MELPTRHECLPRRVLVRGENLRHDHCGRSGGLTASLELSTCTRTAHGGMMPRDRARSRHSPTSAGRRRRDWTVAGRTRCPYGRTDRSKTHQSRLNRRIAKLACILAVLDLALFGTMHCQCVQHCTPASMRGCALVCLGLAVCNVLALCNGVHGVEVEMDAGAVVASDSQVAPADFDVTGVLVGLQEYHDRFEGLDGAVIIADGQGHSFTVSMLWPPYVSLHFKLSNPVVVAVADAAKAVTTPTVYHVGLHDTDVWWVARQAAPALKALLALVDRFPFLRFVHCNPSLRDATRGQLWPATIPVPDWDAFNKPATNHIPPLAANHSRRAAIIWRGMTTGYVAPTGSYESSPRFLTLAAFAAASPAQLRNVTVDLGFHIRCNECPGMAKARLPDSMYKEPLERRDMAEGRVLLDLDGNANSWDGLRWKLRRGAVAKVVGPFVQWFYHELQDCVHLQMVKFAAHDVVDVPVRLVHNETRAALLRAQGKAFARQHFSKDAVQLALRSAIIARDPVDRDWRVQECALPDALGVSRDELYAGVQARLDRIDRGSLFRTRPPSFVAPPPTDPKNRFRFNMAATKMGKKKRRKPKRFGKFP